MNQPSQQLNERLREVNEVLTRFQDGASCTRAGAMELWAKNIMTASSNNNKMAMAATIEPPTMDEISQVYAPVNLKSQFEELYRMLHPALVEIATRRQEQETTRNNATNDKKKYNASAFLQGSRGSGKSLVLEQCLCAFQDEIDAARGNKKLTNAKEKPPFRIVRINGILTPGNNVNLVVHEILRQLAIAANEESSVSINMAGEVEEEKDPSKDGEPPLKRAKKSSFDDAKEKLVRLRQSSFTNHIQLLNEILQLASVDGIPVLFVLDELDAFVGGSGASELQTGLRARTAETAKDRQLLLYHLLDRVATGNSFVSLVGLTCHHGIMNLLEKRIKSRAEGTTKFVHFGPCQSMSQLRDLILDKVQWKPQTNNEAGHLEKILRQILAQPPTEGANPIHAQAYQALQRSQRMGYDARWFCRVFFMACSSYRHECYEYDPAKNTQLPSFGAQHLLDALVSMGAAFLNESGQQHSLVIVNNRSPNARIQSLRDLSGPQVALVFAARRILARDTQRETDTEVTLTLDRMLEEYKTTYRGNTNRYAPPLLWKAFYALLDVGILRPGLDHSGRAPLQYEYDTSFAEMPPPVLQKIPLHLNVDIQRELLLAMQKNFFDCSTALREWGKKTN